MAEEALLTKGEIVGARLTEVAKVAHEQLEGIGFIVIAMHTDGYVQYTSSVDPLVAGAVMFDLGGSIMLPNAKPDWYQFQNALRIMNSIDRHELVAAGILAADDITGWGKFSLKPFEWMMRADDDKAEKLWSIIEKRSAGKSTHIG